MASTQNTTRLAKKQGTLIMFVQKCKCLPGKNTFATNSEYISILWLFQQKLPELQKQMLLWFG